MGRLLICFASKQIELKTEYIIIKKVPVILFATLPVLPSFYRSEIDA